MLSAFRTLHPKGAQKRHFDQGLKFIFQARTGGLLNHLRFAGTKDDASVLTVPVENQKGTEMTNAYQEQRPT